MINFEYKGLGVEAHFSKEVPATRVDPPGGGDLEDLDWWIVDIETLCAELNVPEERAARTIGVYKLTGRIPPWIQHRVDSDFDLETAAYEYHAENGDDEE